MQNSYQAVMGRQNEIMKRAVGFDYQQSALAFDYEGMMAATGFDLPSIRRVQAATGVGETPLYELHNITRLARQLASPGYGARIFLKDEACNPSGSFKARRAAISVYQAQQLGYPGVIAATSGNYGAAVASQAAMRGLKCIIVQEVFDSAGVGQPEILEKARACEAYGAEVCQLTVGPELFYVFLCLLEETGYFNASLYTPYGIAGIESLGAEIAEEVRERTGHFPEAVMVTHAGGGNVTGTARGLREVGATTTKVIGASVDLSGLHMASDRDFNRKSFTTGHTGFGVPFATWPDRADVPRNAARPLRYLDQYVTVTQGEVFYTTEMLAQLEGLERGPSGNTALAAAFAIAQTMPQEQVLVVQETEYTGAGKHPTAQLTFARQRGIEIRRGDPRASKPGESIVIPERPDQISVQDYALDDLRHSYLRNALRQVKSGEISQLDVDFLQADARASLEMVKQAAAEQQVRLPEKQA